MVLKKVCPEVSHAKGFGVRSKKASSSDYLARVKAGEEVLVSDRAKPIAEIILLSRNESEADTRMAQLEISGLARVAKGGLPEDFWLANCPSDTEGAVLAALISERGDDR
jgi:antitoxin (DNA-binding transcriptional repressor) of toxin-antitoxin stability system